jgi:peptide chain release factor 1
MSFNLSTKLDKLLEKFEVLSQKMMDNDLIGTPEYVKAAKERADLEPVVELIKQYNTCENNLKEAQKLLEESQDSELKAMAEEEIGQLKKDLPEIEHNVKLALLPKDEADKKNAIIEVRAGTGGEEAALFAAVLFRMYQRYAERKGWKFEVLSMSETGLDGLKEASGSIAGSDVFAHLKFESGVHRVQRVPETESSGRIHTSAATVAVLPEAEEIDVDIKESELRIDVFRASGAGGQHVNTTDSAVRITHLPTGIVVSQQDEKSQHKNKAKALKILRSRIYEVQMQKQNSERSQLRKGQVGSGDRSERIRTYNYPQSRITDHRINLTSYQLTQTVNEGELDEFIEALMAQDQADKLAYEGDL